MTKQRKTILIISSILVIILLTIGVAYAYYVANMQNGESASTVIGTTANIELTFADGVDTIAGTDIAPGWSASKTFTVTNTGDLPTYYHILISDITNTFTVANSITYKILNGTTEVVSEKTLDTTAGTISGSMLINNGVTDTYTITAYYKNLNVDQTIDAAKTFSFKISIVASESVVAAKGNAVNSIKALAGKYSGEGAVESISQSATTQLRATTEYRYNGSNPNNYVTFNNELWRIIGVFETENSSGTIAYRVKLIRNASLGNYSWDTSASTVNSGWGINEWSQADIMKLLNPGYESNTDLNSSGTSITVNNSLYWNKGSGTCYNNSSNATTTCDFTTTGLGTTAQGMIDTVKYYTTGWNTSNITSQQYYTYERGSAVVSSPLDGVTRTTSWIGKIGLMYVSDYGYAADPSTCARTNKLDPDYYNTTPTCHTNNWLWDSSHWQWTIVPDSSYSLSVWYLEDSGYVGNGYACDGLAWRPVLYLKSDVRIDAGSGTVGDPYTLS